VNVVIDFDVPNLIWNSVGAIAAAHLVKKVIDIHYPDLVDYIREFLKNDKNIVI
jgi:hypothetical protein